MDLTAKERQAYELRNSTDPPMTWRKVGEIMGVSRITARQNGASGADKLANPHRMGGLGVESPKRVEQQDPEAAARGIDALTHPLISSVAEAARAADLPRDTAVGLNDRLQKDYLPVYENVKRLKSDIFIKALERNAIAALEAITPEKYEKLNAYQLTLIAAISLDKKLLIEGKPTQNISLTVEDRRSVTELMAKIHQIAEERGFTKQINPETNQVVLVDREDAPIETRLRHTSKQLMPRIDPEDD